MKAILILGHGSPISEANKTLWKIASMVEERGGYNLVQPAFLQFEKPCFSEAIDLLVKRGAREIIVHPYFLYMGAHVQKDLPKEVEDVKGRYPELEVRIAPHLGIHSKLAEVAVERIEEVRGQSLGVRKPETFSPSAIEAESFRIIGEELDESRFSTSELSIIKRVIHATADFGFAESLIFHPEAIEAGIKSILEGKDIITDVRMVGVGINKKILKSFNGKVLSFISDDDVAKVAAKEGVTRAASAMRKARDYIGRGIVAIGNAPTALMELIRLIKEEDTKPALIIGLPVGFVGAKEAKETLIEMEIPYIANRGRKGGSPVVVAIVNALLIMAEARTVQSA